MRTGTGQGVTTGDADTPLPSDHGPCQPPRPLPTALCPPTAPSPLPAAPLPDLPSPSPAADCPLPVPSVGPGLQLLTTGLLHY